MASIIEVCNNRISSTKFLIVIDVTTNISANWDPNLHLASLLFNAVKLTFLQLISQSLSIYSCSFVSAIKPTKAYFNIVLS